MEAEVYPEPVQTQTHRGRKTLFAVIILLLVGVSLYFTITAFFVPSWLLGEEVDAQTQYLEIQQKDLDNYPMLQKFLTAAARNPEPPKKGISTLIRGTSFEGKELQKFFKSTRGSSNIPYPYRIKFHDKYYGLDMLFQFRSPLIQ